MDWTLSQILEYHLKGLSVLEVGSYNVNGSVRGLFETDDYVGVDMRDGPGVDQVAYANDLPYPNDYFDVVVSTEMLEHDASFWESMEEMARVLKPKGHLLITCRGNGFPQHDYPGDFYRFSVEALTFLYEWAGLTPLDVRNDDPSTPGVLAIGRK
jgi:SAM-dependent methyltransferase